MSYEFVLDALGDPTRRRILDTLRSGARPVGAIADGLPVSRPAVSKHLRVLENAGLVTFESAGTRRLYRVDVDGLAQLRAYVEEFWGVALAEFATYLSNEKGEV
jgi:DNA-binding transcriptional ArsR family regulator